MSGSRLSFLDYSTVEPYLDKDGQQCILAYDVGTDYWQKFTSEDMCKFNKKDVKSWFSLFYDASLWHLPGDLNFPAGIPTPEDLQEIYRCLVIFINSHVWIRDDRAPFVLANWIILSYLRDKFDPIPLLIIDGVTNSGKSTLGKVLMAACYRGSILANFTPAMTVRMVNKNHTSVFLDEFLDALGKKDYGSDIINIIKSMTSAAMPYGRSMPYSATEYVLFRIKTSAAISIKGQEIPEDVINRGIRIQMLTPNNAELENSNIDDIDDIDEDEPIGGSYSLREIRAKLTALKISIDLCDLDPTKTLTDWSNLISEQIKRSYKMLTTKAENGEWLYGIVCGLKNAPMITNRQRKIVKTILSIALLTDSMRDTMEFILSNNSEIRESSYNSFEGEVLRGFVDVLQEHIDNAPFEIFSQSTLTEIIRRITTREIAQRVNDNMHANKDLNRWNDIETRRVTYTLRSLGITYATGKGAGRQSTIDPSTPSFFEHFEALIRAYDPSSVDTLEKLKKMKK